MASFGLTDQVLACRAWLGDTFAFDALCRRQAQTHPVWELCHFFPRHRLLRSLNLRFASIKKGSCKGNFSGNKPPVKNSLCWAFLRGRNIHDFIRESHRLKEVRRDLHTMRISVW